MVEVGSTPTDLAFVPGTSRALVVGSTRWTNHQPSTRVADVNVSAIAAKYVDVPNCAAPIEVLPDGSRALLSPTFCDEGMQSTGTQQWTNPDPVSVIDLGSE